MALIALSEPCVHIVASDDRVVGGEDVHQHWRSAEDPGAVAFMADLIGRTEERGEDVTFRFERLDGDPCSELTCDNCGYQFDEDGDGRFHLAKGGVGEVAPDWSKAAGKWFCGYADCQREARQWTRQLAPEPLALPTD